jgi:hypothetical protein
VRPRARSDPHWHVRAADQSYIYACRQEILPRKSGFYEQVIYVKGFLFFFSKRFRLSCCCVVVGPHIVLHRVSIRTLVSL